MPYTALSFQPWFIFFIKYFKCSFLNFGVTPGCTQKSLLACLVDHKGCQGSNRYQPHTRQIPYLFYLSILSLYFICPWPLGFRPGSQIWASHTSSKDFINTVFLAPHTAAVRGMTNYWTGLGTESFSSLCLGWWIMLMMTIPGSGSWCSRHILVSQLHALPLALAPPYADFCSSYICLRKSPPAFEGNGGLQKSLRTKN